LDFLFVSDLFFRISDFQRSALAKGEKLIGGIWSNPFAYGLFRLATAENGKPCLEQEQTILSDRDNEKWLA
jgi:hypothetical protein